jgi:hypothetical protein
MVTDGAAGEAKKKKKKKKPKKKKAEQSDPPRIGLSKFFPDGIYPEGEIQHYKDEYAPHSSTVSLLTLNSCRALQQRVANHIRGEALQREDA